MGKMMKSRFERYKKKISKMNARQIARIFPYLIVKYFMEFYDEYRYETYRTTYEVAPSFRFAGPNILLYCEGRIVLGENSYIGDYSTIQSYTGCLVKIGSKCAIGPNVRIYTQSRIADQDLGQSSLAKLGDVIIEDNVWIGANVFINPGVTIGTNSIVGANSMVTHDVPPWAIVGGVPAHLIRMKKVPHMQE